MKFRNDKVRRKDEVRKQAIGMLSARSSTQQPDIGASGGRKQEGPSGAHTEYLNWGGGYMYNLYLILIIVTKTMS